MLLVDSREKPKAIKTILKQFEDAGVAYSVTKLFIGDYQDYAHPLLIVDRKQSIQELAANCTRDHDRFKRECQRAAAAGYSLVVLVENRESVHDLDSLKKWTNDHCRMCGTGRKVKCNPHDGTKCPRHGTRKPIQGWRLAKAMQTMTERYNVKFMFCAPKDSARIICDLLGVSYEKGEEEVSRSTDTTNLQR